MVVSDTHFRGAGFTIDINSRDEYFDLLANWDDSNTDRARISTLATRYAYLLFERYQVDFPFVVAGSVNDVRSLSGIREQELLDHPSMRRIIRALETRESFMQADGA